MGTLTLKPVQDGMGYYYGEYVAEDGQRTRVDVLPPRSHPRPSFVMDENAKADDAAWIIYADGEKIARAHRREDLADVIAKQLASR
jgi:hypothetical protein